MAFADAIAFAGHQLHVCRNREAGQLLRWLGGDLRGLSVLDVAGGDGYWARVARRRGARAVSVDLSRPKMLRGRRLAGCPSLIEASERFYLGLSAHGGRAGFNLAAPLTPFVAASDRRCGRGADGDQGSIVLVRARLREAERRHAA
jgi:hypothetical protein